VLPSSQWAVASPAIGIIGRKDKIVLPKWEIGIEKRYPFLRSWLQTNVSCVGLHQTLFYFSAETKRAFTAKIKDRFSGQFINTCIPCFDLAWLYACRLEGRGLLFEGCRLWVRR
jgi:hypothetical protein